jgi:hypothetical protein
MYLFEEQQRFRQWWLWVIMGAVLVLVPGSILLGPVENDGRLVAEILAISIVPVLIVTLFLVMNLKTRIDNNGIRYRLFPLQLREHIITWDEVAHWEVRKYSPLWEYGGWGLRYSFKHGEAINVSGDRGLQLVLKNKKKILIGTQKPDELMRVLDQLGVDRK